MFYQRDNGREVDDGHGKEGEDYFPVVIRCQHDRNSIQTFLTFALQHTVPHAAALVSM